MKKAAFLILTICIPAVPTLAIPENITIGPYQVSFDMGIERQEWNITEKESETYSGVPYIAYDARSGPVDVEVTRYYPPKPTNYITDAMDMYSWEQGMKNQGCSCDASMRTIDGHDGFVAHTICPKWDQYHAEWFMNDTLVMLGSTYPWDSGTLQLLKTIHVEKVEQIQNREDCGWRRGQGEDKFLRDCT